MLAVWRFSGGGFLCRVGCTHQATLPPACVAGDHLHHDRRCLCGLWRSCLRLMLRRYCRFFRLKALRDLHDGGHNPEVLKELRTTTDLAVQMTKVTEFSGSCDIHTCGPGASPLAVSGRHRDADKVQFLKVSVSQTGLFGDAV